MFIHVKDGVYSYKLKDKTPYIDRSVRKKKRQYMYIKKRLGRNLYYFDMCTTVDIDTGADIVGFWEDLHFLSRYYKDIYYAATIKTVYNKFIDDIYDKAWDYVEENFIFSTDAFCRAIRFLANRSSP